MSSTATPAMTDKTHSAELEIHIGAEIRNIGIPPRPTILTRIHSEMGKDEPDFRMLADIISSDVALSAGIMKVANSPFFAFSKKVRSVPEALLVLGLKVTVQTIAGIELKKTFPNVPSLERFWDSAARTAHLCSWLAHRLQDRMRTRPDDAYTFGLFRDCGIPVLMIPFPEYAAILKRANNAKESNFTAIEDEALSINHALVGAELAEDWLLPEEISQAILHHHDVAALAADAPSALPKGAPELIAIAHVVEYLIQQTMGWNKTEEWPKFGARSLEVLCIEEAELAELATASVEVANTAI